jgi:hypothetical protein
MKKKSSYLILSLMAASTVASASSFVCSNSNFYYSSVQYDFGTRPLNTQETGKLTIVHNDKIVLAHKTIGNKPESKYVLNLTGQPVVLQEHKGTAYNSQIFQQGATLREMDLKTNTITREVAVGLVICSRTQEMRPMPPPH